MRILLAACAAIVMAGSAQAVTVINGGFEMGINPAGSTRLNTGDTTSLPGWTVLSNGIDYVDSSVWNAASGSRSVDLSGLSSGGISQRINGLVVGQRYKMQVDVSANPFDPAVRPKVKRLLVSTSGTLPGMFDYNLTDLNTSINMLFETYTYNFTAANVSQLLQLRSQVNNEFGVVIDNVRISAIPEPQTWLMLVSGLGFVGLSLRSRKSLGNVSA
jgi:hypothetical protein